MVRSALTLIRTSLPSVLVLTAALVAISTILADEPDRAGNGPGDGMPAIAPLVRAPAGPGAGTAIGQNAIFDPGRRAETIAGSIDDLRFGSTTPVAAPVTIAGVLLSDGTRKAMLQVGAGAPAWLSVGADAGGWRVAAVDGAGAVIERDGQSLALKIADRYALRARPGRTRFSDSAGPLEVPMPGPDPVPLDIPNVP